MSKIFRSKANFKQVIQDFENCHISPEQLKYVRDLMEKKNINIDCIIMDGFPSLENLTKGTASELIDYLFSQNEYKTPNREYYGTESIKDLL